MQDKKDQYRPTGIGLYYLAEGKPVYGHKKKRKMETQQLDGRAV
jgi:hypothetical protein